MKKESYDLVIKGAHCLISSKDGETPTKVLTDVGIQGRRIAKIGSIPSSQSKCTLDGQHLHVLPGAVDTQVHFREPGLEAKEDLTTGSAAAVVGGITSVFEMPNTKPPTTTEADLNDKLRRAHGRMWCNYAFFVGACRENVTQLSTLERLPGCCGVKIFMGSSTGSLLVDDDASLRRTLDGLSRRTAVHCEDQSLLLEREPLRTSDVKSHTDWRNVEVALRATQRLLRFARELKKDVHVLHVSTGEEIELLSTYRDVATAECTPQHLTLTSPEIYERLGTLGQMNPPIRDRSHLEKLWSGVQRKIVSVIGSDHAPHTLEEKQRPYPNSPSGMPGVQTLLPIMLNHVHLQRLSIEELTLLICQNPCDIYGIHNKGYIREGFDADLTVVDLKREMTISNSWIRSKCKWTPFDQLRVHGWPQATVVGGKLVMQDGELLGAPQGNTVEFENFS